MFRTFRKSSILHFTSIRNAPNPLPNPLRGFQKHRTTSFSSVSEQIRTTTKNLPFTQSCRNTTDRDGRCKIIRNCRPASLFVPYLSLCAFCAHFYCLVIVLALLGRLGRLANPLFCTLRARSTLFRGMYLGHPQLKKIVASASECFPRIWGHVIIYN